MSDKCLKLLVIVGPTAVGKSAVAVDCQRLGPIEIVGADSQQCYAACAVGTAQPSVIDQGTIPHHGIGGRSPHVAATAADFARAATEWIDAIVSRGATPVVVGGTGLYVRALLYGLAPTPPADAAVRADLQVQLTQLGVAGLHRQLAAVDAALAATIHPHHSTRIIRALEIWRLTGASPRIWHAQHPMNTLRYPVCAVGLTAPRAWLRERIVQRVTQQLAAGWIDEVRSLRAQYGDAIPVLRAIGYREIIAHLDHGGDADDLRAQIVQATVQYTKRQMTYFRHQLPIAQWIDVSTCTDVVADITKLWTTSITSA